MSDYRLDYWRSGQQGPWVQPGSGAHAAPCTGVWRVAIPWGKVRPGRDADYPAPSSTEIKIERGYTCSPQSAIDGV
jgi:hypothetical protein